MATKTTAARNDNIEVLLEQSCKTVSGKSDLIFNIGNDAENQLMLRIKSNSGGGYFADSWISIKTILDTLTRLETGNGFSSFALAELTEGRSANTPAFVAAALKALGILKPMEGKQRRYELGDVEGFLSKAKQLQSGKLPQQTSSGRKPATKAKAKAKAAPKAKAKAPRKSPAASRKGK